MLNGTLALHDIRDTEAFCTRIIQQSRLNLSPHEHEDLLTYLIETTWELSTNYRPGPRSFSTHTADRLPLRIIDWQRQRQGRTRWQFKDSTHERQRPTIISIDQQRRPADYDELSYGITPELEHALTTPHRDPAPDRNADHLVRLLRTRSSDEAWRDSKRRKTLPARAA